MLVPSGDQAARDEGSRVSARRWAPSASISQIVPELFSSKAIVRPSGDQAGTASSPPIGVSLRRPVPSAFMVKTASRKRMPVKAIVRPFGDQAG